MAAAIETITYDANTGNGFMDSSSVISSITLPSNKFRKTGYKFSHWNTQPDNTGISYSNGATYSGPSVVLYAQWIPWDSTLNTLKYQYGEEGNESSQFFHFGTTFDKVYDTLNHNFSLQDLAITLKRFFKKQAFMIYSENPPEDNSKIMEWYALSGDTSDGQVDPFLVVNDSN